MAMDPGAMPRTSIRRGDPLYKRFIYGFLFPPFIPILNYFAPSMPFRTTERSAEDLLYATLDDQELGKHPKAININKRIKESTSAETQEESKQKELWHGSLSLAGIKEGETVLENWK
jgi:hypothetical protein